MTFTDALAAAAAVIGGLIFLAMAVVPFLLDHEAESGDLAPVIDLHDHRTRPTIPAPRGGDPALAV